MPKLRCCLLEHMQVSSCRRILWLSKRGYEEGCYFNTALLIFASLLSTLADARGRTRRRYSFRTTKELKSGVTCARALRRVELGLRN